MSDTRNRSVESISSLQQDSSEDEDARTVQSLFSLKVDSHEEPLESDEKPKPKPRLLRQTAEKSDASCENSSAERSSSFDTHLSDQPFNRISITQSSPDIEVIHTLDEDVKETADFEESEKSLQTQVHQKDSKISLSRPKSFRKLLRLHSRFRKSKSEETGTAATQALLSPKPSPVRQQLSLNPASSTLTIDEKSDNEEDIFGIQIHNVDRKLKTSQTVLFPAVKVHVIDEKSGKYLLKLHENRNVAFYYENRNERINYIIPIMSQPCDLVNKIRYPRYPIWEELLVYNEHYSHFVKEDVIIFFEILDLIGPSFDANKSVTSVRTDKWCYRVAWAFLRLVSADGHLNTGNKVRLQLYKPISENVEKDSKYAHSTELFNWWKNKNKIPIQGSLYVTIKSMSIKEASRNLQPSLRSLLPLQAEQSSRETAAQNENNDDEIKSVSLWSKVEGQACKVPTYHWHELSAGNNRSCYIIKFSNDGQKIVCGASVFTAYMAKEKRSSIFLFELPSGDFLKRVNGFHLGTIYDLDWSKDDQMLVSASNDCTSQVWRLQKDHLIPLVLPHPCFVYSARFYPKDSNYIFTGAYDGLIRLWSIKKSLEVHSYEPQLLQEFDGNLGQVLCLAFKQYPNTTNFVLFSGGTKGHIAAFKQKEAIRDGLWCLASRLKLKELHNIAINSIKIHPFGNKIIVYCRDGIQRIIDYKLEIVVQRYYGSLNSRHLIRGCISPCGKYIFAGSEEGLVHVWNTDTGDRIYIYNDLPFKDSITAVEYHPFDHILAISGLNARTISVCLFRHFYENKTVTKQSHQSPTTRRTTRGVLRKSHTIDESNRDTRSKQKMQRAMRKLEVALRLGFSESSEHHGSQ